MDVVGISEVVRRRYFALTLGVCICADNAIEQRAHCLCSSFRLLSARTLFFWFVLARSRLSLRPIYAAAVVNLMSTEGRLGKLNFGLTDETPREDV